MSKKLLSVLLALILILSLCSCSKDNAGESVNEEAVTETEEAAESTGDTEEAEEVLPEDFEPVFLGEVTAPVTDEGKYSAGTFTDFAGLTGESVKFINFTDGANGNVYAFSVSQNDFWQMYWDADCSHLPEDYSRTEIEHALRGPEVLLSYFTKSEGFVLADIPGEPLFLTSCVTTGISAFDCDKIIDDSGSHVTYFEDCGLSLVFDNVETECCIGSPAMAASGWTIGSIVKADVTCMENDGKYKELDWIPKEGLTETKEFVLLYSAYNLPDSVKGLQLNDLWAVN